MEDSLHKKQFPFTTKISGICKLYTTKIIGIWIFINLIIGHWFRFFRAKIRIPPLRGFESKRWSCPKQIIQSIFLDWKLDFVRGHYNKGLPFQVHIYTSIVNDQSCFVYILYCEAVLAREFSWSCDFVNHFCFNKLLNHPYHSFSGLLELVGRLQYYFFIVLCILSLPVFRFAFDSVFLP